MKSAIIALLILIGSSQAKLLACSCVRQSMEEHVDQAQHIFVARIESAYEDLSEQENGFSINPVHADYELSYTLKGNPSSIPSLKTGYNSAGCGIPFLVGSTLLIFTDDSGYVGGCSPNENLYVSQPRIEKDELLPIFEQHELLQSISNYIESGTPIPEDKRKKKVDKNCKQ